MTDKVHIGLLVFDGEGIGDRFYTSFKGWKGSPPMRADATDRPNSDGAFGSVKNYRSARVMTFVGGQFGDSEAAAETLNDEFAAIQSDGAPLLIQVETDRGIRSVIATLSGSAEVDEVIDPPGAQVTAQFIAYDPVKYGPAIPYPTGLASGGGGLEYPLYSGGAGGTLYYGALGNLGRVTVVNNGTADVWPSFVVTGQLDNGFYLQCLETGDILRYDRVVPAGSTVTLDSRTGEVLIDGVSDGSTYLTSDGWFPIPRKSFATIQFNAIAGSSGTPTMTVTSSDGFW